MKTNLIGQSAAKPLGNVRKVQRLGEVPQTGRNAHERGIGETVVQCALHINVKGAYEQVEALGDFQRTLKPVLRAGLRATDGRVLRRVEENRSSAHGDFGDTAQQLDEGDARSSGRDSLGSYSRHEMFNGRRTH